MIEKQSWRLHSKVGPLQLMHFLSFLLHSTEAHFAVGPTRLDPPCFGRGGRVGVVKALERIVFVYCVYR